MEDITRPHGELMQNVPSSVEKKLGLLVLDILEWHEAPLLSTFAQSKSRVSWEMYTCFVGYFYRKR